MARVYQGLDVWSDHLGAFPWKSRLVDVGEGVQQAVVDEGPRDAPLTFVLLHGNPTWGFLYRRFIGPLAQGYRVVVPDHVGFGRSDKPRDPAYYTLERHIANLTATLDALNVRNAVPVIQDWGGPIGTGWAVRHPGRVAGMGVLNTWAFVRDPPLKLPLIFKLMVRGRGGQRRVVQGNFFTETLMRRMGTARRLAPEEMDAYRAPHPRPEDREGVAAFPRMIPETADTGHPSWGTMAAIEDALPKLADKPAVIVWAMGDIGFRKPELERWRGVFRDVDGPHRLQAKHYLQEDAPEAIVGHLQAWAAKHRA